MWLVGSQRDLNVGPIAVALEHQMGHVPDVDLEDYVGKAIRATSIDG